MAENWLPRGVELGLGRAVLPTRVPRLVAGPVTLREFDDADAATVQSVADDPLIPLITTVPRSGSLQDAEAYVRRQRDMARTGAGFSFAITETDTNAAVGQIMLWGIKDGRASTGYWVMPAARRHGCATAALEVLTDWALGLSEVERLQLHVEPWNQGSWRAAERCGYQREGLLRAWDRVGDTRKDMYVYSVLSDADGT